MNNTISQLNFYQENGITTARQGIPDLGQHFIRRESLYRQLGILPAFIRGRSVLEVGAGSGINALYTASLKPERLVLLEPNPEGANDIHTLFDQYPQDNESIKVIPQTVEEYKSKETYDFVFCEGLLGAAGDYDQRELFKTIAGFVSPGGVLVITCMDEVSYLPELLRRLFATMLLSDETTLDEKVGKLLPVFSPHLDQLHGMTRRYEDWIIDNLINPAVCCQLFTIPDALTTLPDQFEFYSSAPHFVSDWRWYKKICGSDRDFTRRAVQQYWSNIHNLLDYRYTFPERDALLNMRLYQFCKSIRSGIRLYEREKSNKVLRSIQKDLQECIILINNYSSETAYALTEALILISAYNPDGSQIAGMKKFAPLFGRGQQYLSLNRI